MARTKQAFPNSLPDTLPTYIFSRRVFHSPTHSDSLQTTTLNGFGPIIHPWVVATPLPNPPTLIVIENASVRTLGAHAIYSYHGQTLALSLDYKPAKGDKATAE